MQLHEALVEVGELATGESTHLVAGRAATVALPEDTRQFSEGEPEGESPPNAAHPVDRGFGIPAIAVCPPCCRLNYTEALVVTDRAGTHAAMARQRSGLQQCSVLGLRHMVNPGQFVASCSNPSIVSPSVYTVRPRIGSRVKPRCEVFT